ncbi:MAG: hypothetical protein J5I98_25230 [Phaeodactylibacter sp.]|nr:hypothetical protein [Phaeodactylibacter sp.]
MYENFQNMHPAFVILIAIAITLLLSGSSRRQRRRRRYYDDRRSNVSAEAAGLFVFLFLAGAISMASQIRNSPAPVPEPEKQWHETLPPKVSDEEKQDEKKYHLDRYLRDSVIPASLRINESPSRN